MNFCKFHRLFIFAKYTLTLKYLPTFRKSENRSSIKSLACYTENEWPNFNEYTITMKGNEWEKDDVKEFARLVKQSKQAWKPAKQELETINITSEMENLISLLRKYINVFAWSYVDCIVKIQTL
jgi:hypothetical protein